jgi:hypothetical protein
MATPSSTVEALAFALRRGPSCLDDPHVRARLARCDEKAIREIATRLASWDPKSRPWLATWTEDDVAALIKIWRTIK